MMANCPKCGKLFNRQSRPICDFCFKKDEECFEKARSFLRENPDKDVEEICEETGATRKQVLRWVREGRLDITSASGSGLSCSKCGVPISTGRVCKNCANKLKSTIGGLQKVEDESNKKNSGAIKVTERKR